MPLIGNDGGVVYNSAVIIDSNGVIRSEYHKVMAESAWAAQGICDPYGVVTTPWGNIGVLICFDTYCGLLPRMRKLQGTDLLIVPANWPKSTLNPQRLWTIHARVNSMYIAVCNRTGKDRTLDCTPAVSCCLSPEGDLLFEGRKSDSTIYHVSLPLDNGRLKTVPARPLYRVLQKFNPDQFAASESRSSEGNIIIHACNGKSCKDPNQPLNRDNRQTAGSRDTEVIVCHGHCYEKDITNCIWADSSIPKLRVVDTCKKRCDEPQIHTINGITIAVLSPEMIQYPELIYKLAECGCDVCVVYGDKNGNSEDILYNCVHRMIIICETDTTIFMAGPPSGHETWHIKDSGKEGYCTTIIPLETVRNKTWLRRMSSATLF